MSRWIKRCLAAAAGGLLCVAGSALADWKPDKLVEIIVPTTPGSGVDNTARTLQAILQSRKLVETPITVVNKPGGSYGVAMAYLAQFNGDGQRVFIQTSTPLTAYITGQLKLNYFEFTPLANLISEPIAFLVRADSPLKSGKELAEKLKADPASVGIALAAARGNAYHIASALIARAAGADIRKLKIVVFNSSGDGATAVMGGHVDVLSATPGSFLPLVQAQKLRILAVASPKRLGGPLASVPTFREQGLDVVFDIPRGMLGPRGLSRDQVAYWEGLFQRVVKSDEWREAVEKNQWVEDFKPGAEMGKALKAEHDLLKEVLTELGMVTK